MPKATRSENTERLDLKSLPGGYVVARKLSYGEKQRRMQIAAGQSIATNQRNNGQPEKVDVVIHNFDIQFYDFSHCIVEHNLTKDDADTIKINFKSIADFEELDDAVGQEIEIFLDKLNNEGDVESFPTGDGPRDSKETVDSGATRTGAKDTGTS